VKSGEGRKSRVIMGNGEEEQGKKRGKRKGKEKMEEESKW